MNPALSFAKPAPINMDEDELQAAVKCIANWVGTQIEQANMPIQKLPSFVRPKLVTSDDGKRTTVLEVRWLDPAAGGSFLRIFTPPKGCDIDAATRIMKHVLMAARGGK